MKQSQFMYELMVELDGVPDEEKLVLMNDYNTYFENKLEGGMSEEQIIEGLKTPHEIARRYKKGKPLPIEGVDSVLTHENQGEKTFFSVVKFIFLIPVCAVYELLVLAFGIAGMALVLALCLACTLFVVVSFVSIPLNMGFIFVGLGCVCLMMAFIMLFIIVIHFMMMLMKLLPNYMGRVLSNTPKKEAQR